MNREIIIKYSNKDIKQELNNINFDSLYIKNASKKYKGELYKLFNLKPYEANILKQLCLSLGFDCAVSRDSITCKCNYTDCILFASESQLNKLIDKLKYQPFRLKQIAEKFKLILGKKLLSCSVRNQIFDWNRPYIMGILNVTPDSFSDGGNYFSVDSALAKAVELINDGADLIDIGGESTRPQALSINVDEEIKRVIPVIKEIRNYSKDIPLSIDTRNFLTAKKAIECGVDIINDVSGFEYDKKLLDFVCNNNIPSIIMHSDSVPAVSSDFTNSDIIDEIYLSLNNKIEKMINSGLSRSNIIADTGIGFGKSPKNCFEILKRHYEFKSLNVPMLLGISRKSFIRKEFNLSCTEADVPTMIYSVKVEGVNIHRVHNVKMLKSYLEFCSKIN